MYKWKMNWGSEMPGGSSGHVGRVSRARWSIPRGVTVTEQAQRDPNSRWISEAKEWVCGFGMETRVHRQKNIQK